MDQEYAAPSMYAQTGTPISTVSPGVIEPLRQTKGWARFLAVMGFIGSGFMILGGIVMIIGAVGISSMGSGSGSGSGFSASLVGGMPLILIGCLYIGFALFYLIPAFWLNRYASRIGQLIQSQSETELVAALHAQKSFWKFVGIIVLIMMCCYALLLAVMLAGAIASM